MVQTGEWLAQRPEATGSWGAQNTGRIMWYKGQSGRRVPLHMCGRNMGFPVSRGQLISEQVWVHMGLCSLCLLCPHHLLTCARPGVSIPASRLRNLRRSSARVSYKGCPSCQTLRRVPLIGKGCWIGLWISAGHTLMAPSLFTVCSGPQTPPAISVIRL